MGFTGRLVPGGTIPVPFGTGGILEEKMTDTLGIAERLTPMRGRDARGQSLATRFTRTEESLLAQAARASGMTLREWSREVLLREARRPKSDPVFTEVVGTRMLLNEILRVLACGHAMDEKSFDEVMDEVRVTKHETARQVMELYTIPNDTGS
jgi:hypothetical protein